MKKIILNTIVLIAAIFLFQCEKAQDWSEVSDNVAPGVVTDAQVENTAGGAIITYTLPADDDLLGVKAVYSLSTDSEELEAYSSAYTDTIKIEGFPDTEIRTVQLIAIDKSKNESEPVFVEVQPLTPPVDLIIQSTKVSATFGGLYVTWENESRADVGIMVFAKDSVGDYNLDYTYYSNEADGEYSFRGFDSRETDFQIQVRDRWENYSGMLDTTLTPLYEEQLWGKIDGTDIWSRFGYDDGSIYWRGDAPNQQNAAHAFSDMWDQNYTSEGAYWHSARPGNYLADFTDEVEDAEVYPIYFTIDLGKSCQLSRHKLWHRATLCMQEKNPKYYEIWATNETPKGIDDFDTKLESLAYWTEWEEVSGTDEWKNDWTQICTCDGIPPSGATTAAEVTDEDIAYVTENGLEYDILPQYTGTPFRYIRFVCDANWSGGSILHIGEIEFWGAYVDE
ncbi:DUF5126 domain-containing protein [Maribellus maritimus]|uniref:DUF5126 domain-containing protein n=1 Tax=Maribellus maritimus TaxID=2870838 RepID=UPI001EE9D4CA|nr:DUF5126 domain-containing protein [Maribellus maritimus]MCG6188600.1 DUF5126 domain-containing protein [Maribellus maritimus]